MIKKGSLLKPKTAEVLFDSFIRNQTISGVLLILVSIFAFTLANGEHWERYHTLSHTHASIHLSGWTLDLEISHWVNEALMVLFFFVVGLEIKREFLVGELSSPRKASLAIVAAIGGMIVPAVIYTVFNTISPETRGAWGVPMATDIAFALGVLSLLGPRVPTSLKVFLTGLAIVDDLGAILVIAIFYSENFHLTNLLLAFVFVAISFFYGKSGGTRGSIFAILGVACWYFVLESGIHSTIAGVLIALTIPIREKYDLHDINDRFKVAAAEKDFEIQEKQLGKLTRVLRNAESPLHRFEHTLQPWVMFGIMPLFAFFNAGVHLPSHLGLSLALEPHFLGIFFGLLLGKPIGVLLACTFAVKKGWAQLPTGVGWPAMIGVGCLAGLGFTMSLFISVLGFEPGSPELSEAKLAILLASISAMILGAPLTWLGLSKKNLPPKEDIDEDEIFPEIEGGEAKH